MGFNHIPLLLKTFNWEGRHSFQPALHISRSSITWTIIFNSLEKEQPASIKSHYFSVLLRHINHGGLLPRHFMKITVSSKPLVNLRVQTFAGLLRSESLEFKLGLLLDKHISACRFRISSRETVVEEANFGCLYMPDLPMHILNMVSWTDSIS